MTRSPARMMTPPINESSTSQSRVTFVPRRFSIASMMVARCALGELECAGDVDAVAPFAGGALLGEALRDIRQQREPPVLPDHLDEVAAGIGELVAAHVDEELDEPGPVHPRIRDEAAHRRIARDRGQQLEHPGPFAEPALFVGLLEGGDRVGPR